MLLPEYADIIGQIIEGFGAQFPRIQIDRMDQIHNDPRLQIMLDNGYVSIDVGSKEYIFARETYARKNRLLK